MEIKFRGYSTACPTAVIEIQYVFGDGNERSICTVDVRHGQATIPDQPLDAEGLLELEPVDDLPVPDEENGDQSEETEPDDADAATFDYPAPDTDACDRRIGNDHRAGIAAEHNDCRLPVDSLGGLKQSPPPSNDRNGNRPEKHHGQEKEQENERFEPGPTG